MSPHRAITLQNQLVILAATTSDAGTYYAQAVNERNGENKTSPAVALSVTGESHGSGENHMVLMQLVWCRVEGVKISLPWSGFHSEPYTVAAF